MSVIVGVISASASVVVKKMGSSPSLELPPSLSLSPPVSMTGMACLVLLLLCGEKKERDCSVVCVCVCSSGERALVRMRRAGGHAHATHNNED